jgi:8-oxo-dGTP diphosphatase
VPYEVARVPASAGALIFDARGRLLILKPTYKTRWSIPGGQIEHGESPWDACRRETEEECGLVLERGRLVAVDFLPRRDDRPGGLRYLFHCGCFSDEQLATIRLDEDEIEAHLLASLDEALKLLSKPLRRRVKRGAGSKGCVYLEDGRRVSAVS